MQILTPKKICAIITDDSGEENGYFVLKKINRFHWFPVNNESAVVKGTVTSLKSQTGNIGSNPIYCNSGGRLMV